uniref:Low density lipoprotein receptor-related protein associated protein 1 n=1 Tax=Scophthalmus maximus TaxID=52904 RepID=A0A8D3CF23_SCOMX
HSPLRVRPNNLRCLVAALCLGVGVMAGKYSREVNEHKTSGGDGQTVEFRIAKLNQVWEKAKRMQLSPVWQAELHSDLKIQEKDEMQWKKMKVEELDENGEREAQLRRNFNVILAKYGMDGKRDTRPLESNSLKDHDTKEGDIFDDPRLNKLWNKAKSSGKFSSEELLSLKREFQHHKDKIHEYNILMDMVSRTEEIHKNEISPLEGDAKEHVLHRKHTELKQKMRDLTQGFERLRKLSHEGFTEDSEFREPRVIELWEAAKRANLSGDELDSLKEELHHFETKVEKHSHYQEQLELSHQKLRHVESLGNKEHIKRNQEKYNTLSEKTREMGYKMKKHLQDLSNKISSQGLEHNEL